MKTLKTSKSHKLICVVAVVAVIATIASACGTVAVTGRKQLMLVSDEDVLSLSNKSYKVYMDTVKGSTDKKN
ncbi:MAG: hypothetical protein WCS05_04380, partial [Bacteroidales bacterium]